MKLAHITNIPTALTIARNAVEDNIQINFKLRSPGSIDKEVLYNLWLDEIVQLWDCE